jgi:hypothetical protein
MSHRLSFLFAAILVLTLAFAAAPANAGGWDKELEKQHEKDWNVTDTPDGAMYQILNDLANIKAQKSWAKGICQLAALNVAWNTWTDGIGNATMTVWKNMIKDILSNIYSLGDSGLEDYIKDLVKDGYKGALKDKIKNFFKGKKVKADAFKWSGKNGDCDIIAYVVADVPNSVVTVIIHGDCHCNKERCFDSAHSSPVSDFTIRLTGQINSRIDNSGTLLVSVNGLKPEQFDAYCDCVDGKPRVPANARNVGETPGATGGGSGGTATPRTGGEKKGDEKTCPSCQKIAEGIADAEQELGRLDTAEHNVQKELGDIENGNGDASKKGHFEQEMKRIQKRKGELNKQIDALEAEKGKCEKDKCSYKGDEDRASYIKEGATGYAASHKYEEEHARGRDEDRDIPRSETTEEPQRDSNGCVASAGGKTSPAQRAADKERLDAEVNQRQQDEKQASKKYDDAIAKLERRRYGNFVTSEETYTSEKSKLRRKREDETASLHDATLRAQRCRDNYLKATGEMR